MTKTNENLKEKKPTHVNGYGEYYIFDDGKAFRLTEYGYTECWRTVEELCGEPGLVKFNGVIRYDLMPTEGGMDIDVRNHGDYVLFDDYESAVSCANKENELLKTHIAKLHKMITATAEDGFLTEELFLSQPETYKILEENK